MDTAKAETPRAGFAGARKAALVGLCVLPFLLLVAFVERRAVNVPYSDEWDLVPLLHKQALGTLRLSDFWAQHNEHRDFFPQLILVKFARLTGWNLRWELVLNVVMAVFILTVVIALLRAALRPLGSAPFAIGVVAAAWLLFSPMQWENWLSGWQLQWFLFEFAAVGAIALLSLWPAAWPAWMAVAAAIVLTVISSYSLASGLFVWVAALYVFLVQPRYRAWLPLWLTAAALTFAFYLRGYREPLNSPPLTGFLHHPSTFVLYLLAYLGTALEGRVRLAVAAGLGVAALFVASVFYLFKYNAQVFKNNAGWVSLAAFTLLAELETAVGRSGYGVSQATSSRYTTADTLFVLSVMVLCMLAFSHWSARPHVTAPRIRWVGITLTLLLAGAIIRSYWAGIDGSRVYRAQDLAGQACMARATESDHGCLAVLGANEADFLYAQLTYLRSSGLGGQRPVAGG